MDYSSDWLLAITAKYRELHQKEPIFISDWDVLNNKSSYPEQLLIDALENSKKTSYKYLFADEQIDVKERIQSILRNGQTGIEREQITLTISATASLYLTILSLNKRGVRRFLVFTPVYYTVLDTLKDISVDIIYFPLFDHDSFNINFSDLEEVVCNQEIECIFFVDPIYSGGIEIQPSVYDFLVTLTEKYNVWIICDYTLGGLEWNQSTYGLFPFEKIKSLNNSSRFIFIDSISKRLLVNGLKISIVIGCPDLILEIENYASQVYGGFSSTQIEFAKEVYSLQNELELSNFIKHNVQIMKNNFETLEAILINTNYTLLPANSAYFTMISHNVLKTCEINAKEIIKRFLFEENLLAFPSFHFSFHPSNKFAFRVNILKDLTTSLDPLNKCIRKDVK